jgi:hypothetical protein
MPTWLAIVLAVVLAVVILLAAGGAYARRRQLDASRGSFDAHLAQVNEDLAAAHAEDRGWARDGMDAAARAAYASQRPGAAPEELTLVQVVDRPGTDEDKAVYRVASAGREERLTLGRRGGDWVFERLG